MLNYRHGEVKMVKGWEIEQPINTTEIENNYNTKLTLSKYNDRVELSLSTGNSRLGISLSKDDVEKIKLWLLRV